MRLVQLRYLLLAARVDVTEFEVTADGSDDDAASTVSSFILIIIYLIGSATIEDVSANTSAKGT